MTRRLTGRALTGRPIEDSPYVDGALGRLETGQPLRAVDLQELSYAVGRDAALRLQRAVEESRAAAAAAAARSVRRPRGFLGWLLGAPHLAGEPLPAPLARLVRQLRTGSRLTAGDNRQLARVVGRAGARAISRRATRTTSRAASRALSRKQGRRSR